VHVGVLGPFEVVIDDAPLELGSPQQRAVLAVLALRPNEVVATDTLVDALWPDDPPRSAVQVVRTYVSRLRQVLAAATGGAAQVSSRSPGYRFDIDPAQVDARRFEELVRRGHAELDAGRAYAAATTFRRGLELWRGQVLSDLAWLRPAQAAAGRLDQLRLAALEGRIDADLFLGRHAELAPELEALTSEHPLRERLWAQLMVARYRTGQQTAALAAYQRVRAVMVDEFGIEPGPELRDLERQVLCHAAELRLPERVPIAPPLPAMLAHPVHDRPLVGRERDRAMLAAAFEEAHEGHFGAVFVSGPPGIGKTALAAQFARGAWAAGSTVLLGRADEGSPTPFHALREAVVHWARHRDAAGDPAGLSEHDLTMLARLAPELASSGDVAASGDLGESGPWSDHERLLLFDSLARWVEAAAGPAPLVLLLDDLQWADQASLQAVRHLLRHPPAASALLVVTHRDVDLPADHPLLDLLGTARSDGHVRRIVLTGLGDGDVAALVAAAAAVASDGAADARDGGPSVVDPGFAAELARVTGGNPLFLHETVRYLIEKGAITARTDGLTSDLALTELGVPEGIKEVIEQRLRRLPDATVATLRHASVVGEQFDLTLLESVTGQRIPDLLTAVEPALDARLVGRDPDGRGLAFTHSLVRDALLDRVSLSQRARVHWRTGVALVAREAIGLEPPLAEIAHHLTAGVDAGDPVLAIDANVRAGHQAMAVLAFEDGAARFETAVDLCDRAERAGLDLAFDAALGLGQAGGAINDRDRQRKGFLRAAAVARLQGRPDRLAHAAIGFVDYLNAANEVPRPGDNRRSDQEAAQELLDDALAHIGDAPTTDRCLLLTHQATRAMTLGRTADARAFADAAVATARELDDPAAVPFALVARLWSSLGAPCDASLRDAPRRALAFSAPPRHRVSLRVFVVPMLPIVALQLGDRPELDTVRARVAADPDTHGSAHLAAYARMWEGAVALSEGRLDDAERLAFALPGASAWGVWHGIAGMQAISAVIERGDPSVVSLLAAYLADAPGSVVARAMLASVQAGSDPVAAAEQIAVIRRERDWDELGWASPIVLRHIAEAAAQLDDAGLAFELLPVLAPFGGQMLVSFNGSTIEAAADRSIGQVLSVLGRHDDAIDRLAAAQALEAGFGADALVARTTYWSARAHLVRNAAGDHEVARRLLREVAASAEHLGMHRLRRDAEALDGA
jgi:DNA-binding SARP family transcriptional activator